jgi:YVTN family beta-propeller protein
MTVRYIILSAIVCLLTNISVKSQNIVVTDATGIISTCLNTPSASPSVQQFTTGGTGLIGQLVLTSPVGFEISTSSTTDFESTISLTPSSGTISNTTIFVRAKSAASPGAITGNVTIASTGAISQTVPVTGRINGLPGMAAVTNKIFDHQVVTQEIPFVSTTGGVVFNWTNSNSSIGLAASGHGNIPAFTPVNDGVVPVQSTITVTPVSTSFAYMPWGNNIRVLNATSGEIVKTIPVGSMPTGVGISPDGQKVFVSNRDSDNVSVISTNTLSVIATIPVGDSPNDLVMNHNGTRVYVLNESASTVSVINTVSNLVIATIPVTVSLPNKIVAHPTKNRVFVAGTSSIAEINTSTNAQINTYSVGNALTTITGFTIDKVSGKIYVADGGVLQNKIYVLIIDTGSFSVTGTIATSGRPDEIVISPDGAKAYIALSENNVVAIANLATNTVTTSVAVGNAPEWVAISPDGLFVYALSNFFSGPVSVINTVTQMLVREFEGGGNNDGSGNFISPGTGCRGTPVTFTITVNPVLPELTVSKPMGVIAACEGTESVYPQIASVKVSGVNMRSSITITAPTSFEISLTATSGFGSSLVLSAVANTVPETIIYVRSNASAPAGELVENLILTTQDATPQDIIIRAWIDAQPVVDPVDNYVFQTNTETDEIIFTGNATTFDWTNTNPSIGLLASGSGWIPSFTSAGAEETLNEATITVTPRSKPLAYIPFNDDNNYRISVMDLTTRETVWTHTMPDLTRNLVISPDGKHVYTSSISGVHIVNTQTRSSESSIEGIDPNGPMAISADGSKLYVAMQSDKIRIINTVTRTIIATINVYSTPSSILLSRDGQKLFISYQTDSVIDIIDTNTNTVIDRINIVYSGASIKLNSNESKLYVTHSSPAPVSVIDLTTKSVTSTIPVTRTTYISLSPDDQYIFLKQADTNGVTVVDANTNTVIKMIETGLAPAGISISRDGRYAYVPTYNFTSHFVSVIEMSSLTQVHQIPLDSRPYPADDFMINGFGCAGSSRTFKISITPQPPTILTTKTKGFIEICEGTPSLSPEVQKFYISGTKLIANVVVTGSPQVEVSLFSDSGFGNTVTIPPIAGTLDSIPVYARGSALAPNGDLLEIVQVTSTSAETQLVEVKGFVHPSPEAFEMPDLSFLSGSQIIPLRFTGGPLTYIWTNTLPGIGLPNEGVGNLPSFTAINSGTEPITATISIQSKSAVHAYVRHNTENDVLTIVNTETGENVKEIPLNGTGKEILGSNNGKYIYVSVNNFIHVVSTISNTIIASINVDGYTTSLAISKDDKKLYANVYSKGLVSIDTETNSISAIGSGGAEIIDIAVDDKLGVVYAYYFSSNPSHQEFQLLKIDAASLELIKFQSVPMEKLIYPAITLANGNIFVNNGEKTITVLDEELVTVSTIELPYISNGYNLEVSPNQDYVYAMDAGNNVYEINSTTYKIERTVYAEDGLGFTGLFKINRQRIYLVNNNVGLLSVVNMETETVLKQIPVGEFASVFGTSVSRSTGCIGSPTSFTITIYPEDYPLPDILVSTTTGSVETCEGVEPENHQQFTVSGKNLSANLDIVAPQGFELSLSSAGPFTNTLHLTPNAGIVSATIVHVRIQSLSPAGLRIGEVMFTSDGANAKAVAVTGTILGLPVLQSATLTTATVGQWYNYYDIKHYPGVTFTATGLPNGLTISSKGEITGVPSTSVTNYQFQIHANNGSCTNSAQFTITINKGVAGITITNATSVYNGTSKSVTVTTSPENLPTTVTYNGSETLPIDAGSYVVQVTVNSTNYTGSKTGTLIINRKQLTVTANNATRAYGQANPAFSMTYTGFVSNEAVAVLDQLPTIFTNATSTTPVGQYSIIATSGVDNNYSYVYNTGTLTIIKANQTITFAPIPDKQFDAVPFTVIATASSSLPVTFSIVSGPATITGNVITVTGEGGDVLMRASQAGNGNFNSTVVDQTFTVIAPVKENQNINFPPIEDQPSDAGPFTITATASSTLPVTFNIVSGPATLSDNTVTLTGQSGDVTVRSFQAGNINFHSAVAEQTFSVFIVLNTEPDLETLVKLYPNPAKEIIKITVPMQLSQASVELVNSQGQVVSTTIMSGQSLELSLADFSKGLYMVIIKKDHNSVVRKLITR